MEDTENLLLSSPRFLAIAGVVAYGAGRLRIPRPITPVLAGGT